MRTYTIEEAIEELKSTVQVFSDGYGTWNVTGHLGYGDDKVEDYFTTHDESWKTGIFDGEQFNDYANSEQSRQDCEDNGEDYDEWYETVTHDSADEDNYEQTESRDRRAAKEIINSWMDLGSQPDRLYYNDKDGLIFVLTQEEDEFAIDHELTESLTEGNGTAFLAAWDNRDDN